MLKTLGYRRSRAFLLLALAYTVNLPASAQSPGSPPQLPPGPQPVPGPAPTPFGTIAAENYLVSSAANEHGSYLWIVAPIQHVVILCQKPESSKDFSCTMKRLP
jgi:hypothetical protein